MRPTTPLAFRRVPTETDAAPTHTYGIVLRLALALLALVWPTAVSAKVEWIGNLHGKPVYLIWGGECSALDPPNDNVATVTITYTGPPQPGLFTEIELFPPFDSYTTDGSTYVTVTASTPMPLPCPTCFRHAFSTNVIDPEIIANPGTWHFHETNHIGGFCAGPLLQAQGAEVPAIGRSASTVLTGVVLLVGVLAALRAKSGDGPILRFARGVRRGPIPRNGARAARPIPWTRATTGAAHDALLVISPRHARRAPLACPPFTRPRRTACRASAGRSRW